MKAKGFSAAGLQVRTKEVTHVPQRTKDWISAIKYLQHHGNVQITKGALSGFRGRVVGKPIMHPRRGIIAKIRIIDAGRAIKGVTGQDTFYYTSRQFEPVQGKTKRLIPFSEKTH